MEPNELNDKPKFNWKRLLITVGIVIVTAGAIGGSVYYVMNQQAQKDKESAEKTAQELLKQIDDLKKTETPTTTPTITTSNVFDFATIKVGDKVAGMTVTKINRIPNWQTGSPGSIQFSGRATIAGDYSITTEDEAIIGDNVCVRNLDATSLKLMPKEKTDTREVWFCFTNKSVAKSSLGPTISGKKTMTIDNYFIDFMQSSVWNTATFIQ